MNALSCGGTATATAITTATATATTTAPPATAGGSATQRLSVLLTPVASVASGLCALRRHLPRALAA